jgi:uncharacterized protein with HEPN domain
MSKDDLVYIGHMLDMGQKALSFISGIEKSDYNQNESLRMALTHIVQIMGEAAGRVSIEFRKKHSEIPWHEIIGMRHRIVHDYMGVDEDVVWQVVHGDLPVLVKQLEKLASDIS